MPYLSWQPFKATEVVFWLESLISDALACTWKCSEGHAPRWIAHGGKVARQAPHVLWRGVEGACLDGACLVAWCLGPALAGAGSGKALRSALSGSPCTSRLRMDVQKGTWSLTRVGSLAHHYDEVLEDVWGPVHHCVV